MKILVISDTHISPLYTDIEDYRKLGEYCVKHKPDVVIHLGDVADLDSLNHVIAKRGTYSTQQELKFVEDCLKAFVEPIKNFNRKQRKSKHKMYKPHKYLCLGNHDVRKDFEGIEILMRKYGFIVQDYLKPVTLDGISFVHCVMNGTSGQVAITPKDILQNAYTPIVVGHSHKQGYESSANINTNEKIFCIKCPAYNRNTPDWAEQCYQKWDRGFTIINTSNNEFIWRGML